MHHENLVRRKVCLVALPGLHTVGSVSADDNLRTITISEDEVGYDDAEVKEMKARIGRYCLTLSGHQ